MRGFTMVELLVVILIVAVLAALALATFLRQQGSAQDREAMSTARVAQLAEEVFFHDREAYTADRAELEQLEPTLRGASVLDAVLVAGGYRVTTRSASGRSFWIERTAGVTARGCDAPGDGGCQDGPGGAGTW